MNDWEVKMECLTLALALHSRNSGASPDDEVMKTAKKFEKFVLDTNKSSATLTSIATKHDT